MPVSLSRDTLEVPVAYGTLWAEGCVHRDTYHGHSLAVPRSTNTCSSAIGIGESGSDMPVCRNNTEADELG